MYLTIEETANQLGRTVRQVRYMIDQGKLPARKQQGRWTINSDDLPRSTGQQAAQDRKERKLRRCVEKALDVEEESPRRYSVLDLKAFQIALPLYREAGQELGGEHPAALELRRVLELLAQGCHRFDHTEKAIAYREARDAASAAICELVLAGNTIADQLRERLEQDLMACLAGLLRRLDRRGRGR